MLITHLLRTTATRLVNPSSEQTKTDERIATKAVLISIARAFRRESTADPALQTKQPVLVLALGLFLAVSGYMVGHGLLPAGTDLSGWPLLLTMAPLVAAMLLTVAVSLVSVTAGMLIFIVVTTLVGVGLSQTSWPLFPLLPIRPGSGEIIQVVNNFTILLPARWMVFCYSLMALQLVAKHDGRIRWYERLWLHLLVADLVSAFLLGQWARQHYLVPLEELQVYTAPIVWIIPEMIGFAWHEHPPSFASGGALWSALAIQAVILVLIACLFVAAASFAALWVNTERLFPMAARYDTRIEKSLHAADWRLGVVMGIVATFTPLLALLEAVMLITYAMVKLTLEYAAYGKIRRPE